MSCWPACLHRVSVLSLLLTHHKHLASARPAAEALSLFGDGTAFSGTMRVHATYDTLLRRSPSGPRT